MCGAVAQLNTVSATHPKRDIMPLSDAVVQKLLATGHNALIGLLQNNPCSPAVQYLENFDIAGHLENARLAETCSKSVPSVSQAPKCVNGDLTAKEVSCILVGSDSASREKRKSWSASGERLLKEGKVGVVLLAGGQGTRLGWSGPKGTYPIGPISENTLYAFFAQRLHKLETLYGQKLPFYIMTSSHTDAETRKHFEENAYFGLDTANVRFFRQEEIPALALDNLNLLMSSPTELALSPEGNGGVFRSLEKTGQLADMTSRGIEAVHIVGVDNVLQELLPSDSLGILEQSDAEVVTHYCARRDEKEKVGCLGVRDDGRAVVIEYSDMPAELASKHDADGKLYFSAGSHCSHIFKTAFLNRLVAPENRSLLQPHVAIKSVPYYDIATGQSIKPEKPNALKLELFIFDAFPAARLVVGMERNRNEVFAAVKNREGEDSPASARKALSALHRRWLTDAGISILGDGPIEINPCVSLAGEGLKGRGTIRAPAYIAE